MESSQIPRHEDHGVHSPQDGSVAGSFVWPKEWLVEAVCGGITGLWYCPDTALSDFRMCKQTLELLGYADQQLEQTVEAWRSLIHPEHVPMYDRALRQAVDELRFLDLDMLLKSSDGSYRWFQCTGRSFCPPCSAHKSMAGTLRDIHEQKSKTIDRDLLFEQSLDLLCVAGFDGRFRQINPSWSRVLGWSTQEMLDRPWLDFVHPDDHAETIAVGERIISGQKCYDFENRYLCKDGSYRWMSWNSMSVLETKTIYAVVRDITEARNQAEQAALIAQKLFETNASLEEAQATGRLGNWSYTLTDDVVIWSRQVYWLFGLDPTQPAPGYQGSLACYAPEDADRLAQAVEAALRDETPYSLTLKTRHGHNGVTHVRAEGYSKCDAGGCVLGLFGTVMDVTAEVRREEALRAARHEAEEANRIKSAFLANMSHEIRTPLTAILGFVDLLEDVELSSRQDTSAIGHIKIIRRNAEQLLSIVNDILDQSKIESGKMSIERSWVDLREMLSEADPILRVRAEAKNLEFHIRVSPSVPQRISTDGFRLRQIVLNLLSNAIKFTHRGEVLLSADMDSAGKLVISVRDTGIGLSQEQTTRLFQAFEQADTSTARCYGGTGLGLNISQQLAHLLGGELTLESELGSGSTFTLSVDISSRPDASDSNNTVQTHRAAIPQRISPVSGPRPLEGLRVLLAEDSPDNQRLLVHYLTKAGALVTVVDNGEQAVAAFTVDSTLDGQLSQPPPYDLLLTDLQMPTMDGYQAVSILRSKGSTTRVVAMTAYATTNAKTKCRELGFDGYATKPINPQQLIDVCAQHGA